MNVFCISRVQNTPSEWSEWIQGRIRRAGLSPKSSSPNYTVADMLYCLFLRVKFDLGLAKDL